MNRSEQETDSLNHIIANIYPVYHDVVIEKVKKIYYTMRVSYIEDGCRSVDCIIMCAQYNVIFGRMVFDLFGSLVY